LASKDCFVRSACNKGRRPRDVSAVANARRVAGRLAHRWLPDINRGKIWRMTAIRPQRLREQVREALN
jgi:hypothetical protein